MLTGAMNCLGIGFLLASADGGWFPWINFLGVCIMALSCFAARWADSSARHRGGNNGLRYLPRQAARLRGGNIGLPSLTRRPRRVK